jgi:phosphodiesterase/alkaline phosphatase D-like protein
MRSIGIAGKETDSPASVRGLAATMFNGIRYSAAYRLLAACVVGALCLPSAQATLIQFGSCNNQNLLDSSASIYASITSVKSDVFIWLGDIIYTDKVKNRFLLSFRADDTESVRQKFTTWKRSDANMKLENSTSLLMGVWDDHDFGINDGGSEHEFKTETQQIFLDYMNVPLDSPRRLREGVYSSEVIGEAGERVRIILLDARFHRDPIGSDGHVRFPPPSVMSARLPQRTLGVPLTASGARRAAVVVV